jgi:putative NADH-flavin reductase
VSRAEERRTQPGWTSTKSDQDEARRRRDRQCRFAARVKWCGERPPHLPRRAVYAATKAFLVTFTEILATELQGAGEQGYSMAHVLIIGASKGIGLEATRQALEAGHDVRALARSAISIGLSNPKLEKVRGDALNSQDVEAALNGVDVVIQTLGVGLADLFRPVHLFSDATRVLVAAMKTQGVKRLICVTGFGAGDSRASISCLQRVPFQVFLGRAYDDKGVQERLIKESPLVWTIARPGVLTDGPRTGRYRILEDPSHWRNGVISRSDVAEFLVRQIDDQACVRKAPVLVN